MHSESAEFWLPSYRVISKYDWTGQRQYKFRALFVTGFAWNSGKDSRRGPKNDVNQEKYPLWNYLQMKRWKPQDLLNTLSGYWSNSIFDRISSQGRSKQDIFSIRRYKGGLISWALEYQSSRLKSTSSFYSQLIDTEWEPIVPRKNHQNATTCTSYQLTVKAWLTWNVNDEPRRKWLL